MPERPRRCFSAMCLSSQEAKRCRAQLHWDYRVTSQQVGELRSDSRIGSLLPGSMHILTDPKRRSPKQGQGTGAQRPQELLLPVKEIRQPRARQEQIAPCRPHCFDEHW